MSDLYLFKKESDYSEENTCENEVLRSTILHQRKKLNIHASDADLLHTVLEQEISIGAKMPDAATEVFCEKSVL